MTPIISIDTLTRSYSRRRGVEDINLSVPEGALFGFLGPNGAGKTTTIRVLIGLLRPTRGTARIFGLDCWRKSHIIKADVGYIPGDLRLYSWMNGAQALSIFGAVRKRDMLTHGRELAERFELDLRVKVRAMSRGMRQKLGLILALAHKPRLLILDEPTASLDPLMQDSLQDYLRAFAAAGHTVFFSSHTLSEVERLCDRVAIVRAGRLVADDSLASLRERAGHIVTIRWKNAAQNGLAPPEFLHIERRDASTWTGALDGPVARLIDWLAGRPIDDLSIAPPDLESLFRRFYSEAPGEGSGGAAP